MHRMSSPHSNFGGAVGERGRVMLAGVVEHTKERLKKKKKRHTSWTLLFEPG
jgi:hypothetical protein